MKRFKMLPSAIGIEFNIDVDACCCWKQSEAIGGPAHDSSLSCNIGGGIVTSLTSAGGGGGATRSALRSPEAGRQNAHHDVISRVFVL